ncbi:MAG: hypothetical protein AAF960_18680 [Bacteroidota bacterium]
MTDSLGKQAKVSERQGFVGEKSYETVWSTAVYVVRTLGGVRGLRWVILTHRSLLDCADVILF